MEDYRVIIIDPDPTTTKYLAYELKKAGLTVYATNSLKEGLILAYQTRPHVMIIEPLMEELNTTGFLVKLHKDRRTSRTRVIAFSSLTEPDQIQAAIEMGFFHYMAKEGASVPLLIEQVLRAAAQARGTGEFKGTPKAEEEQDTTLDKPVDVHEGQGIGKLIVFLSAKGGVGTSSICANLAQTFNPTGEINVAVVDMVLPIGSIASIVGYDGPINIVEAAARTSSEISLEFLKNGLPKPDNWNFKLLAGCPTPEQGGELEVSRIPLIINNLRRVYDYVFLDLGRSLSRISLPLITSASQIVLMLNLDQTTVDLTKSVFRYLLAQGVAKNKIYLLINRAVGMDGITKTQAEELLGTYIPLALPHMGRDFSLANNLNIPVSIKFPQDAVSFSLVQIAEQIHERMS